MNAASHFKLNSIGKEAVAVALTALLAVTGAAAQIASGSTGIDATGNAKSELAACHSGKTQQSRATCIIEVQNANAAKRAGKLDNAGGQFKANAMKRCDALAGTDKLACEARMSGYGNTQGSVAGGGVIREIESVVVPSSVSTIQIQSQPPSQPSSDTIIVVPAPR